MATENSPVNIPAKRLSTDQKQHRANAAEVEKFGQIAFGAFVPIGGIVGYGGANPPSGWLRANGAAINRRAYKELFSIYGTTYGVGDGSTTFNIPTQAQARAIFGGTGGEASAGFMIIRTGVF